MTKDRQEQEIELSIDPAQSHAVDGSPAPQSSVRVNERDSANPQIVSLGKDMTDDEFLHALTTAPEEMLIPWEEVPLPSMGIYYPGWENAIVRVKAMTQSVEKAFTNRRLVQSGGAIARMFEKCVELPGGMDAQHLLVGDHAFLLYYIRGLTYGNLYKFVATCPMCSAESSHVYDMNELYATVVQANESLGAEPFRVELPHLTAITGRNMWVGVRFLRQADITNMFAKQKFTKRLGGNTVRAGNVRGQRGAPRQDMDMQAESMMGDTIEQVIASINGNTDQAIIQRIIASMHSRDHAAIRDFMTANTPGIDTTVRVTCQECSNEATMVLPVTENFFRSVER